MDISIIEAVGSAVLALFGWGLVLLVGIIKRKFSYDIVDKVAELALHVVKEVWQVWVEELKENDAFDKDAQEEAKARALSKLKSYLGPKGIKTLVWLFGHSEKTLDEYLSGQIEAAIVECKNGK